MIRTGVFGTGTMGKNHVRLLAELPGSKLVGVHDADAQRARALAGTYGTEAYAEAQALAQDVDAAVLAVPTVAHADLGCRLLEQGIHLLVEKPLAGSLEEADRLVAAAEAAERVLAVGHVEFFNPAVQAVLGLGAPPRYVEVQRLSEFSPRSLDVDVILDLMIHDLQILHALDPSEMVEVRATGIEVLSPKIDIANVRVELASGCVANLTASRVSSDRVRKLRLFYPSRYVSLDYREQDIKSYRLAEEGEGERAIVEDRVPFTQDEPLKRELEAFLAACRGAPARVVTGRDGRRALATALAVVDAI